MAITVGGKVCKICGIDLSQARRVRDGQGGYCCMNCFQNAATAEAHEPRAPHEPLDLLQFMAPAASAAPAEPLDLGRFAAPAQVVHYPCRVCDELFVAADVYGEADGDTICKTCWEEHTGKKAAGERGLPQGLELVPSMAPDMNPGDQLFCERCSRYFPPENLMLSADGSVQCKNCARAARWAQKDEERRQARLARFRGEKLQRDGRNSGKQVALAGLSAVAGIAWLLFKMGLFSMLSSSSAPHRPVPITPASPVTRSK